MPSSPAGAGPATAGPLQFTPAQFTPNAPGPAVLAPVTPSYTGTAPAGTQLYYSSTAVQTVVAQDLGSTLIVGAIGGFPVLYPFTLLLEWGTSNQEVVTITSAPTGNGPYTYTGVLRGQDGTAQITHSAGAQVNHGVSARDFAQIWSPAIAVSTNSSASGTVNLDPLARVLSVTMTGNCTFTLTPSASLAGGSDYMFSVWLTQDSTGSRTAAWPGSVSWIGGVAPTLPTAPNTVAELVFETINGGATWYGAMAEQGIPASGGTVTGALAVNGTFTAGGAVTTSNISTKTANYTVTTSDCILLANTAAGPNSITFTLPDATTCTGQQFYFVSLSGAGNVYFATVSSQTIGAVSASNWSLQSGGTSFSFVSDGANWQPLGNIGAATSFSADGFVSFGGGPIYCFDGVNAGGTVALAAGATSAAPLTFQSGTNLTTPAAGAMEYDAVASYLTNETTSGRGLIPVEQKFRLTSTGGTISTIANYFGSTSNISLVSGAEYEIEVDCWFLKTTASTIVWTFTNSAAPTAMNMEYKFSPAATIVSAPANSALFGEQYDVTTATATVTSASLTTAVNHHHKFWIRLINGTGTSLKIQATSTSGTITPGINSSWKARRVPAANVGTFSA